MTEQSDNNNSDGAATATASSRKKDKTAAPRLSVSLDLFSPSPDGFNPGGYREETRLLERIVSATKIRGISGVEVSQREVTSDTPAKEIRRLLKEYDLSCSAISVDLTTDRRFALAGFAHQHAKTRNAAIDEGRKAVDAARALGTTELTLRLYSDGFDYPFHIDYQTHWNTLISSIKTIAKYASPDVNVAVSYKPREPRKYLSVDSVGRALSLCQEIAMKNVGVAMNFSHAMMAGENPADSIAFLSRASKLFMLYLSDSYRLWDDQLVAGSVHLWELMEALHYVKSCKYKGYLTIEGASPRMDPVHACQIAVGNVSILWKKLERLDMAELRKAQRTLDAVESQKLVRRALLQG